MTTSEQQIEQALITKLTDLKYTYRPDIRDREALEKNFRAKFEALNKVTLTDAEFARLRDEIVTADVFTASKNLRTRNTFTREDGTPLQYTLVNIKDWCKNDYEVINQLRINTANSHHRYDVILLINGVPVVQIELKTLQVSPRRAMQQIVDYKNDPGNGYQAEHPPIITKSIWDDAHAILSTNGRVRAGTTRAATQYLLKGIVFGSDGRAMSPFQTAKQNGRRYRYYVPQRDIKEHAGASGLPRMPAAELESAVLEQLRGHLRSPDVLKEVLPQAQKYDPTLDEAIVTVAMKRLDDVWDQLFPAEQMRIVRLLVRQVNVSPNNMSMDLHPTGIQRLVLELHHKKLQPETVTEMEAEAMA